MRKEGKINVLGEMVSVNHPNRSAHNWLVYNIGDKYLVRFTSLYKGILCDLGAGEAPYRDFFLKHADHYVSIDWPESDHSVNVDISANLNKDIPLKASSVDTIVSLSVMEHLCEPQQFLYESHRILKSNGHIILQVPFMWWVHEAPNDYFRYTKYGLEHMLHKAGFDNIEIYPQSGFWVMWVVKFNYQSRRLIRGPWLMRKLISGLLRGIWAIDQRIAPWLDRFWKCEGETIGYFVVAEKK